MAFTPEHMTASEEDFEGNNGIGRYVLLPGSDGRAEKIAQNFSDVTVTRHSRRHNVYKGTLEHLGKSIDVAAVSSGMGTPSLDIIVNELGQLGVKRFPPCRYRRTAAAELHERGRLCHRNRCRAG